LGLSGTNMLLKKLLTHRSLNLLGFVGCTGLILTAFWFQYVRELEPCPLCMAQRIMIYASGSLFLVATIHHPAIVGQRVYAGLILLFSLGGMGLSSRQLWLQSLPADQVPACGPGLDYMLDVLPWAEILSVMVRGTGDCAEIQWTFLGLSIPGWTLVAFIGFGLLSMIQMRQRSETGS